MGHFSWHLFLFFGPGIRYVPGSVFRSIYFWAALAIMIFCILIYHQYTLKKGKNEDYHR